MDENIASPCTNVCAIDETRGLCRGCWRTIEEITRWNDYSRAEKLLVVKRTVERNAAVADTH
jgi:uncharacterized protein